MPAIHDLTPVSEWRRLARAMSGMHADDRVILVSVLRQLVHIEAVHGPDVAEAALDRLILRLNSPDGMLPN